MKVTAKAKTAVKAEESANGQVIVADEQVRISLQEKRRQYRGFELEKKYKPGPLSLKQPLTDALKAIARMRAWKAAWALYKKAEQGDVAAFREVADRVEGRVQQTIEVGGQINLAVIIQQARARVGGKPEPQTSHHIEAPKIVDCQNSQREEHRIAPCPVCQRLFYASIALVENLICDRSLCIGKWFLTCST